MDFVVWLPRTLNQCDFICVVVDRITKFAYIIPVRSTYSAEVYARIFIGEIFFSYQLYRFGLYNSHLEVGGHSKKGWIPR